MFIGYGGVGVGSMVIRVITAFFTCAVILKISEFIPNLFGIFSELFSK